MVKIKENLKLSENFYLDEFTFSRTAIKNNINNYPNVSEVFQIQTLVDNLLQPLRIKSNSVIKITSGFRCLELNRKLDSKDTSQHIGLQG